MKPGGVRGTLRGAIGFSLITSYQLVVRQGLFLRTLLETGVTGNASNLPLDLGWYNVLRFKLIYAARFAMRDQRALDGWFQRVQADTLEHIGDGEPKVAPLPELTREQLDPERFYRDHVLGGRPVVIRGALRGNPVLERWDMDWLRSMGDARVNIGDDSADEELQGTLGQALASQGTARRMYVYGATNVLRDHPELVEELGVLDYKPYLARGPLSYVGSQLFAGVHKRTGVGWHCAMGNNLFFMIRGKKRWRFAHPDCTWLLYPLLNRTSQTLLSPIGVLTNREFSREFLAERFPLANHVPFHEVVLEPGDVLFNPSWYWHRVDNLTEESVAVSSRWLAPFTVSYNRLTEAFMMFSGHLNRRKFEALRDLSYALSDENSREIYRNKDDRVDFGRPGAYRELLERTGIGSLRVVEDADA